MRHQGQAFHQDPSVNQYNDKESKFIEKEKWVKNMKQIGNERRSENGNEVKQNGGNRT